MLSEKPWKMEALLRLGASILVCVFLGTLASTVIQFFSEPGRKSLALFLVVTGLVLGLFLGALVLLHRAWPLERRTLRWFGVIACLYLGLLGLWWTVQMFGMEGNLENSTARIVLAVLSFQGAALVLIALFVREHRLSWSEAFGFRSRWRRALLLGAEAAVIFLFVAWMLQWWIQKIIEYFGGEVHEQMPVQVLRTTSGWGHRSLLAVVTILLVPPAEELIFRGILYPAIKQRGHPQLALWGTAMLFGAIHMNLGTFLPLMLLALVLTWLYEKTDNLLAPIAAHSLFNAANFTLLFLVNSIQPLTK